MSHVYGNPQSIGGSDIEKEKESAIFREETASIQTGLQLPELLRDLSEEERHVLERKLVRTIDIRLLPILVLMYIMNYLDRNNIASARLAGKVGMQKELKMTSTEFSVCSSHYPLSRRRQGLTHL